MRYHALDGLRGIAAIVVVIFHFMSAFTPSVVPDQSATVPVWADSPLAVLFNGTFAVYVFFVLSGFVLSNSSLIPRRKLYLDLVLRYARLAIPATASVLIAWVLLKMFPSAASQLEILIPGPWLSWTYQDSIPGLPTALQDGLVDVFIDGESMFNNVLWTMRTELIGSLAIYVFFHFVTRWRLACLTAVSVLLACTAQSQPYMAFTLGAILSLAVQNGIRLKDGAASVFFVIGMVLGSQSTGFADRAGLGDLPDLLQPGNFRSLFYPVAAALVVAGVLWCEPLRAFFAASIPVFAGKISFPLYLLHVPLLYTVFATVALSLEATAGVRLLLVVAIPFFAVATIAAWAFDKWVDQPVLGVLKRARQG